MAFDYTKPNSTARRSAPIVLTGVEAVGHAGLATPSPLVFQAPEIAAILTGVQAECQVGTVLELPNIVMLTGVQANCHLSDDDVAGTPGSGTVVPLSGIRAITGVGSFSGAVPTSIARTKPASVLDIPTLIKALQVPGGPCQGALYRDANKGLINWYAANIGVSSIIQFLSATDLDLFVRPYLDSYLVRMNSDGSIQNVAFNSGPSDLSAIGALPHEHEDAYAATFIRAAYRYVLASQNFNWFDTNKGVLGRILDNMIADNLRDDGLVASFAGSRRILGNTAYLKNNCEAWAALNEYSTLLTQRNDTFNAARYSNIASSLSSAIDSVMWVATGARSPAFKATSEDAFLAATFNPNAVAQAYPQAMGLTGLSSRYTQAYTFINTNAPGWENLGYDPEPWMVLGLVAALRGDSTKANTQTLALETMYASTPNTVPINELGMYQRIKSILAGLPQA